MRLNRCLDGIVCGAVVLLNAAVAGAVPSSDEDPRLEALRRVASEKGYDITETVMTSGCLAVSYVLRPTDESYIRCRLALPVARAWSGRFWGFGNGGPGGGVNLPLGTAIAGDAGVHTDLGTSRGVFGKREVLRDFGWRATHLMTVSAKDLTAAYFGRQPDRCYFRGASTGGGQGFHEALRFPEDYDGILAYVPANTRLPLHVYFAWNLRLQKDAQGRDVFSREEFAAVEQAALDWFADKDDPSARGKFLTDTRYSPSVEKQILDLAKARVPTLAEGDKLERLHRMFEGPVLDGKPVHAGVPFSASLAGGAGNQWMLQWYLGPNRPLHTVTDAELVRWMETWGPDCDACGEGVSRFFARGGKMIVVGGLEDSIVPYPSMVDWYERAAVECGGRENLARSCRLYLLPGRAHGQGRGCGDIRGDVAALVRWVETGTAPEAVQSPLRGGGVRTVEPWSGTWPAPGGRSETVAEAVSPDGRNAIRLRTKPLGYEVLRDGRTLVPFSPIGLKVDGVALEEGASAVSLADRATSGRLATPVYKKAFVDLTCNGKFVDFGKWGVALAARNDGVAWRFEMKTGGRVDDESASVSVPPEAKALVYKTDLFGCEERIPQVVRAKDVTTGRTERGEEKIYLPLVFETSGKTVAVTESDLRDYPCWYLERKGTLKSVFAKWPRKTRRTGGADETVRGRKEEVVEREDYLVKAEGPRTLPWRVFVLADEPAKLCESDAVYALARPAAERDWSWVRPGKVQWDWWNAFHNVGEPEGCTTEAYVKYIDFAAEHGVEYVILDEGWSEKLNIWKFSPVVDVKYLLEYAAKRKVGIILWMAWAQAVGEEARVAEAFAKMGVKGFKVDFMDRGDAQVERFLWTFAEECARRRLLVDYHGVHRPAGLSRTYPNVLNYEAVHGLEQMKWYRDGSDKMFNDVAAFFGRMTAGPMDYTPGAMDNYPVGGYPKVTVDPVWKDRIYRDPGSVGTRCHQMAMMALYEAPLQMLADAPAKYAKNPECFRFMAETPVVWVETVGLGGTPDTYALAARKAADGSWYVAAINNSEARTVSVPTAFLGSGTWKMSVFRDAQDAAAAPTHYIHESRELKAGEPLSVPLAPGGGFVARMREVNRNRP